MSQETTMACEDCGGRFDRPGLFGCDDPRHPAATLPQRIVDAVERSLNDRRGLKWTGMSEETLVELRDSLAAAVAREIAIWPLDVT